MQADRRNLGIRRKVIVNLEGTIVILHKKDIGVSIMFFLDHIKHSQSALMSLS